MNAATIAAITAANVAAQNAAKNASNTNYSVAPIDTPLSVIIATICLIVLFIFCGIHFVEFSFEHPIISVIILIAIIILCAFLYSFGVC